MEIREEDEIRESFFAECATRMGITDFRPGGKFVQLGGANARSFFRAQQAQVEMRNSYLLGGITSTAEIDARAADVLPDGEVRETGLRALGGGMVFSRPAGTGAAIEILPGTVVYRKGDKVRYATIGTTWIPQDSPNSTAVSVVADQKGSIGNCAAGAIDSLGTAIPGVTMVTNTAPLANGVDEETVDAFKDRIRQAVKSIGNSTGNALVKAAREYNSNTYGKVRFAKLSDAEATDRGGYVKMYIDDGAGSAGVLSYSQGVVLLSGAAGVERVLYTSLSPMVPKGFGALAYTIMINGVESTSGWSVVEPWGQVRFDSPLAEGDIVELVNFGYYSGLVSEVQRVIDGDLTDAITYPGKRSAGVVVQILPASKTSVVVAAYVILNKDFDPDVFLPILQDSVAANINGLNIGDPVYRARIYDVLMSQACTKNVTNLTINGVDKDLYIGESSVARTASADINI